MAYQVSRSPSGVSLFDVMCGVDDAFLSLTCLSLSLSFSLLSPLSLCHFLSLSPSVPLCLARLLPLPPQARTPTVVVTNPITTPFKCHASFLFFHFQADVTDKITAAIVTAMQSPQTAQALQNAFQDQHYSLGPVYALAAASHSICRFLFLSSLVFFFLSPSLATYPALLLYSFSFVFPLSSPLFPSLPV